MNAWNVSEVMPGLLAIQIQIQAGMAQQLNLKSCFVTGSIENLSFKPLIFIPDVLKTSQEEDVNTNQDQICWFRSILTLKDMGILVC